MKVLDLACQLGHSFEGWFGSEEDFQSQLGRGLVQCPICDDAKIIKKLSAPRLNISGAKRPESAPETQSADAPPAGATDQSTTNSIALRADFMPAAELESFEISSQGKDASHPLHALMRNPQFQEAYMEMAKEVLAKTDDVGKDFAREARKIHYGKEKDISKQRGTRGIRGQASHDETMELLDEGIDVMPLPLPSALKGTLQ